MVVDLHARLTHFYGLLHPIFNPLRGEKRLRYRHISWSNVVHNSMQDLGQISAQTNTALPSPFPTLRTRLERGHQYLPPRVYAYGGYCQVDLAAVRLGG